MNNYCALICRFILLILLLYSIVLSCMVINSCHFISAISPNESTHGVGLTNFEDENGNCETHNTYVIEHYNGMEIAAKVCGYVAPGLGVLVLAWLVVACCKQSDGFIWGGKCIPLLMLLGCIVCQAVTFLLFQSELFCNNKDITKCEMGDAGFRSIQACLVYAFCFILFYCGPTPEPFNNSKKKKGGNNKKKKKKKKTEPGKNEDWTKEMYEARRKEKKAKSRGVSGRSKKEIFDEHNRQSASGNNLNYDDPESQYSDSKKKKKKKQSHSSSRHKEQKYGDYVDTEPDGMDWSAYTPEQREVYYEKQRIKEREKKEEKEKMRQWEDDGHLGDPYSRRDSRGSQEAYSVIDDYDRSPYSDSRGGGADSRGGGGHQHEDSYYSRGDDRGYEDSYYSRGDDQSRGGHEGSYYSRGRDDDGHGDNDKPRPPYRRGENGDDDYTHDNDYDSRGYDSRRGAAYDDDYTQDEYTRGEDDDYTQDDADNSRAVERYSSQSNSRSRSSRSQHEDSYYSQDDSHYRDDIY